MVNFLDLFKEACKVENQERQEQELKRQGELRGGNTGYLVDNQIKGSCAREAVMRYFGVDKPISLSRKIMFAAGEKMEEILIDKFKKVWGGQIFSQEQARTQWDCEEFKVTGSPDVVLADKNGKPIKGIECKMVSSIWTLRDVSGFSTFPSKPKAAHLAQACHYMRKLGQQFGEDYIDWSIIYICPVDFHAHTKDLRQSKTKSEFAIRGDHGDIFKVESHLQVYDLAIDQKGKCLFNSDNGWTATEISTHGIEDYYKLVADCIRQKKLPPRMHNTDCFGKPLTWDKYSKKYNDYSELHDLYDSGKITFEQFISKAKEIK